MAHIAPRLVAPTTSSEKLLSLDSARNRLAVLWGVLGTPILLILVVQSLLGKFGANVQNAWGWFLPTILPTVGMIITVLGYTAFSPKFSNSVVRSGFFWAAFSVSGIYLLLVSMSILIQPFVPNRDPIVLFLRHPSRSAAHPTRWRHEASDERLDHPATPGGISL
jgi:hypothetical protein